MAVLNMVVVELVGLLSAVVVPEDLPGTIAVTMDAGVVVLGDTLEVEGRAAALGR